MNIKKDYFKIGSTNTLKETFKLLIENLNKYTNDFEIYEVDSFLYFEIETTNFKDYNKFISNFSYYNECFNISEDEFNKNISTYDLRNDLKEVL